MSESRRFTHPVTLARRATRRRVEGDETGFTLIELVIVVAILPIVIGGIAMALLSVFGLQNQTNSRIGDSNDELVSATNFSRDVQSAAQLTYQPIPSCGASTQFQILGLEWGQNSSAPGGYQTVVSYVINSEVISPTKTQYALVRQQCFAGATTMLTSSNSSTHTLSNDVSSTVIPLPNTPANPSPALHICGQPNGLNTNSCGQSESSGIFPEVTASYSSWHSTQGVTKVELDITEPGSSFSYSLVGLPAAGSSQGSSSGNPGASGSNGCGFANSGTGTYANALCFINFSGFNAAAYTYPNCDTMTGPVAGSPYSVSFCISVTPNTYTATPSTPYPIEAVPLPTYGTDAGFGSEAFLGNNGFYTGVPGDPALYQLQVTAPPRAVISGGGNSGGEFQMSVIHISNFQVLDAAGNPATGWTLVTGDAESTDSGEWTVYQDNTTINGTPLTWSVLPNNGASDPFGNACYDSGDTNTSTTPSTNNYGFMAYTGTNGAGLSAGGTIPAGDKQQLNLNNLPATGTTAVLCETKAGDPQLNKTGTLMLQSQEPSNSSAAQSMTIYMNGHGYGQAIFVGVLL